MSNALKIAGALGAAAAAPTDPDFSSVSLLLHGDGTNGAQNNTFIDGSSNNFTITRNGNTTQGTFSPFTGQGGSGYFDGTGDYLTINNSSSLILASTDFTCEAWVYVLNRDGNNTYQHILRPVGSADLMYIDYSGGTTGVLSCQVGGTIATQSGVTLNTWHHVAVVRSGTSVTCYVNGVGGTPQTINPGPSTAVNWYVGWDAGSSPARYLVGYISNVRVLTGTALYTANFTPPTSPLTAITNTSLLLNFTNAGITDSARKANLETVGNAQINTSVVKYGTGSMAFDGNADLLVVPDSPSLEFGSGAFTVEFWYYPTTLSGQLVIMTKRPGSTAAAWIIYKDFTNNGADLRFSATSSAGSWTIAADVLFGTVTVNQWHHVAVYRVGNAWYGSVNGVVTTIDANDSGSIQDTTNPLYIGGDSNGKYLAGYLDDIRITKGVARYGAANFTPPTAAFPDS